jgi:hypothetical protein
MLGMRIAGGSLDRRAAGRSAMPLRELRKRILIGSPPIRIRRKSFATSANRISNRRKTQVSEGVGANGEERSLRFGRDDGVGETSGERKAQNQRQKGKAVSSLPAGRQATALRKKAKSPAVHVRSPRCGELSARRRPLHRLRALIASRRRLVPVAAHRSMAKLASRWAKTRCRSATFCRSRRPTMAGYRTAEAGRRFPNRNFRGRTRGSCRAWCASPR